MWEIFLVYDCVEKLKEVLIRGSKGAIKNPYWEEQLGDDEERRCLSD